MATAQSPTCTASELPILAATGSFAFQRITARSVARPHPHLGVVLGGIAGELHLDAVGIATT